MCLVKTKLAQVKTAIQLNDMKESIEEILQDTIELFLGNPFSAIALIPKLKTFPTSMRDAIFFENLEKYITTYNRLEKNDNQIESENLQSLACVLADASPNYEANYEGNQEVLQEYAKRLIKLIDDCGTKQKAYYLACLTRALILKYINPKKFFQLSRCIKNLTEEDIDYLKKNINEGNISRDEEYIEDYRALGLIYETDDGFSYSKRAFELKKYALCYEEKVKIPEQYPERYSPLKAEAIPEEDIVEMFNSTFNNNHS